MSVYRVLDNWSDYESRKLASGNDPRHFSCDEAWEVKYLKTRIRQEHPYLRDVEILQAIESSCRQVPPPRLRHVFVENVLDILAIAF